MKTKHCLFFLLIIIFLMARPIIVESLADIIELEVIKPDNKENVIEAKIKTLSEKARQLGVDKISIIGSKNVNPKTNIVEVNWHQLVLGEKNSNLAKKFKSKVLLQDKFDKGDILKAEGDNKFLAKTIEDLINNVNLTNTTSKVKTTGSGNSANDATAGYGNYNGSSNYTPRKPTEKTSNNLSSTPVDDPSKVSDTETLPQDVTSGEESTEESTTSEGCSVRIDYNLHKIILQERTLVGSREVRGCHDSATSFDLQKNYDVCPTRTDLTRRKIISSFQYFYVDQNSSNNSIGDCVEDLDHATDININRDYSSCPDFIDLGSFKAYSQYQESYKDSEGKDVITKNCTTDSQRSYSILEDFTTCEIRHLFDQGYSVAQNKLFYTKGSDKIIVQDCQDSSRRYEHHITNDTCPPQINSNAVILFNRKYVEIDGIRQYITTCEPLSNNSDIYSENCLNPEFTHDFTANQSFRNKTTYYLDNNRQRVEISNCVKSEEFFNHQQDSEVCSPINDDINHQTIIRAKKYITVNGIKQYITDCESLPTPIPYREIGYKWKQDLYNPSSAITVANSGDNVYLGSKNGREDHNTIVDRYDISKYSTTGKCNSWSSPAFNSQAIDLISSNRDSIMIDNYVENRDAPSVCYTESTCIRSIGYVNPICAEYSNRRICSDGNLKYYQRCTNHRCPLYKVVKVPIYQRNDSSKFYDEQQTKEPKYLCGVNFDGHEVYNQ
jgi:hypothetical protein